MQLVTVLLDLIAKNASSDQDRIDVPLALLIIACKVNGIDKESIMSVIEVSWDDLQLITHEGASDESDTKH